MQSQKFYFILSSENPDLIPKGFILWSESVWTNSDIKIWYYDMKKKQQKNIMTKIIPTCFCNV